ncbi:hypothetical protein B0J12DRAFT_673087 [Macrophomina phaseolina]|uniref:Uncharacterized protein n=1 Tax=Macrophomina phaseolina TaxID=35725 RepID=A0ABQ8G2H2_9PEZI|nr:hypothetical protein B0J12DRAFT_673087 [Macrophomina phaseolina]
MASQPLDDPFSVSAPVIAEWREDDVRCLGTSPQPLSLELRIHGAERQASLKLRLSLALSDYRKKRNIYLLVHPERVLEARPYDGPVPDRIRADFTKNKGAEDAVGVGFRLKEQSVVLAQSGTSTQPKRGSSAYALESLGSLSRATSFVLYVSKSSFEDWQLESLYSLADGDFRLASGELESLYGGKGATNIPQTVDGAGSPPSYDELALSPPPQLGLSAEPSAASGPPVKKRKYNAEATDSKAPAWRAAIQQRLDALTEMVGEVRKEIASAAAPAMETQGLSAHVNDLASQLDFLRDQVSSMEQRLEKKFEEKLESRLAEATDDIVEQFEQRLEKRMEEISDDMEDRFHQHNQEWEVKLDDTLIDMKEEARQRVNEEMLTVEDSIRADIRHALS